MISEMDKGELTSLIHMSFEIMKTTRLPNHQTVILLKILFGNNITYEIVCKNLLKNQDLIITMMKLVL